MRPQAVAVAGRKLGWHPDRPKVLGEKPDLSAASALSSIEVIPDMASARRLIAAIIDQGGLGSCVANAGFQAIRASHVSQLAAQILPGMTEDAAFERARSASRLGSRLFGYYFLRAYIHTTDYDSGGYNRDFFRAMNKFGFPMEEDWTYDDRDTGDPDADKFCQLPSTLAMERAFDQKSPTIYRRIMSVGYERIEDVKRAIAAGYVVVFGTRVDEDFASDNIDPTVPLAPPTSSVGGHAMCIAEYNGDDFGVVNSWGDGWGDYGWCRFSADYLTADFTHDLWIVEHAPRYAA